MLLNNDTTKFLKWKNFPPFELIVSNGVVGAAAVVAAAVAVVVDESHSRFEI